VIAFGILNSVMIVIQTEFSEEEPVNIFSASLNGILTAPRTISKKKESPSNKKRNAVIIFFFLE